MSKAIPDIEFSPEKALSRFKKALGKTLLLSKSDLDELLLAEEKSKEGQVRRGPKRRLSALAPVASGTD